MSLSAAAEEVLGAGELCYLAALTPRGPHVTPVVFVYDAGEVWATTSRGAVKARAWRDEPRAAGLVGVDGRWVSFRGTATMYDLLDPSTWPAAVRRAPRLALASARFTAKNARYFAGYARDARRIPLAWTPPARVLVSVRPEHGAVLGDEQVLERWGRWPRRRAAPADDGPEPPPAPALRPPPGLDLGESGPGALAVAGPPGSTVLPTRWRRGDDGTYALSLSPDLVALAGIGDGSPAALAIDRASRWRASRMRGLMVQGTLAGAPTVRLRPERLVWWKGWASGSVMPS